MTVGEILSIVFAVLTVAGGFVSYYFYIRNKIQKQIAAEIENAEDEDTVGAEKMAQVVATLKKLVPIILKPFITDSLIESLVQAAFNAIEAYAKKQVEKSLSADEEETEEATDENAQNV